MRPWLTADNCFFIVLHSGPLGGGCACTWWSRSLQVSDWGGVIFLPIRGRKGGDLQDVVLSVNRALQVLGMSEEDEAAALYVHFTMLCACALVGVYVHTVRSLSLTPRQRWLHSLPYKHPVLAQWETGEWWPAVVWHVVIYLGPFDEQRLVDAGQFRVYVHFARDKVHIIRSVIGYPVRVGS